MNVTLRFLGGEWVKKKSKVVYLHTNLKDQQLGKLMAETWKIKGKPVNLQLLPYLSWHISVQYDEIINLSSNILVFKL